MTRASGARASRLAAAKEKAKRWKRLRQIRKVGGEVAYVKAQVKADLERRGMVLRSCAGCGGDFGIVPFAKETLCPRCKPQEAAK
jgi:predicted Zn-ribbon and HTH transcriptional regulator